MALAPGSKIGPYEIVAAIGAGGMGEVYRAHDPKLKRDVALKVLPDAFANDPERLARFTREAQVLASLNHSNIAQIYGVEGHALVMELVEGASPKGPMAFEDGWKICSQIANALEYAHDKGIVHRDLKPSNVKVTPEGVVKLLDFGLAKAFRPEVVGGGDADNSPTLTLGATQAGVIMGTAAYMAPEQAKGKSVDKRADIWAFGVVFYELLTGERLFKGEDVSDTLAQVLTKTPEIEKAPVEARRLLRRCLERDPRKRLRDIAEAKYSLEEERPVAAEHLTAPSRSRLGWGVAGVLVVALAGVSLLHFRETAPVEQMLRYTIAAPEGSAVHSFALSPDGRYLVIAAQVNGKRQLWLRGMDALQAQPMQFTEDATYPFWSPDSRWIGFFAQGKLKKVAASGGPAQSLCDTANARGGSWSRDDVIVFSPGVGGISIRRVPAAGGVPVDVTKTQGDQRHPTFLPDGRHFLYMVRIGVAEKAGVYVSSLDGKEDRRVLADVSGMAFAPPAAGARTGHLLFVREGTLMAVPFDGASAQISGEVFPVAEGVSLTSNASYLPATVSENGVLLYLAGGIAGGANQIGWYDRAGKSLGPVSTPGGVFEPAISPDEKFVVFRRATATGIGGNDLWVRDLNRGTETRFTSDPSRNLTPFWSPNGDRVAFASDRAGAFNLYQKGTNGSGQDEPVLANSLNKFPSQWSRDGKFIVYQQLDPKNQWDLSVLPMEGGAAERKPQPFLGTEFNEFFGQLSSDSHWLAFTSDRSGRREVYVRPFPPGEGEWPISVAGGEEPRWRGDGKELFFEGVDGKMTVVPVKRAVPGAKPVFEVGAPVALFDAHMARSNNEALFEYDVTSDGKRFLINTTGGAGVASAPPLTVVVNWSASGKK